MATSMWDQLSQLVPASPAQQAEAMGAWGAPKQEVPLIAPDSPLNFEQRILHASKSPSLKNKDGSVSTHRMAWGEVDDKFVAYPTIVQDPKTKKLKQLGDREAFEYAMQTGEYREFSTPDEASAYADNGYKKYWDAGEKKGKAR